MFTNIVINITQRGLMPSFIPIEKKLVLQKLSSEAN